MKIGILTYHRACNFGAVLQAYALQKTIANCNVDCEIIDYNCEALKRTYRNFYINSYSLRGFISAFIHYPVRKIRNKKFKYFREKNLILSKNAYNIKNLSALEAKYDKFVVGSDQVWNTNITGNDPTYFLGFVNDSTKKYSYAASIGSSDFSQEKQKEYIYYLSSYQAISVREHDSCEMLEHLLGRKIQWLLDPVFLLSVDQWKKFVSQKHDSQEYIFAYCLREKKVYKFAEHLAKLTGLKIIIIPNDLRGGIKAHKDYFAGVEQFLTYIYHAKYVVTDSFHATAFSIIFHKNVNVVLREGLPNLNNRLLSVMQLFCIKHKIVKPSDYDSNEILQINYAIVDKIKEREIMQAMCFIKKQICGETP